MPSSRMAPGPNGLAIAPTVMPSPTGIRATRSWPPNCQRARRSNLVVEQAHRAWRRLRPPGGRRSRGGPARRAAARGPTSASSREEHRHHDEEGDAHRHAAAPGHGRRVHPARVGKVDRLDAAAPCGARRGQDEGEERRREERDRGGNEEVEVAGHRAFPGRAPVTPPAAPGPGSGQQMPRTSAAIRACSAGSSRVTSVSTSSRPTSRISAGPKPAGGHGRRPDPDPRRDVRGRGIEGDRVLVHGDPDVVEEALGLLAGRPERPDVDREDVVVGAPGDDPAAARGHLGGQRLRVLHRSPLVRRGTPRSRPAAGRPPWPRSRA